MPANLLDTAQPDAAVAGSDIVYFTAGLPADTQLWEAQFPRMLRNAIDASRTAGAKFEAASHLDPRREPGTGPSGQHGRRIGQTWDLPAAKDHPTYRKFALMASEAIGSNAGYSVLPRSLVNAAGLFSKPVRELTELLPRYGQHNIFDSTKSTAQFPDFRVTGYRDGLATINQEADAARRAGTSPTPIRTLGTDSQPTFSIGGN